MNSKKILFILPWLKIGGLERVQVTIANALSRRGHDVTVMTYLKGNDLVPELDKKVRFIFKPPKAHGLMKKIPYIRNRFYDDGMWEKRASPEKLYNYYVGREKYDVEIAFFRGRSIKIISGSTNKKSVKLAWVHSDFKLCGGVENDFKNMEEVKNAYSVFDNIVCVSDAARQSFNEVIGLKDKSITVYNLLPKADIISKSAGDCEICSDRFNIIAVGHLIEVKGFDRLLQAVKRLNDEKLSFDLWIIGDGQDREKLERYAVNNNLSNVHFTGNQVNPYKYVSKCDLSVCTSRLEGFNLTVAEALILGIPVMSTRCTGPVEILGDGEYGMIADNSTDGITDGLRKLITDRKLYEHYKSAAKKRQDFFDEEKIILQIENLFRR